MEQRQDYYVYLHRRGDNNEVFYVGKGRKYRAKDKRKRNQWWKNIVAKYGYSIEYVETHLSEQDAFDLEVETIKFYRETGQDLCNLTNGGDGIIGYVMTEEDKERTRKHLARPEFKEYVSKIVRKPVLCSNGMVFDSCASAQEWVGVHKYRGNVAQCCRREIRSAFGFVWRFLEDCADLQVMLDDGKDAYIEWGYASANARQKPRKVYCSNGMEFDSCYATALWMNSIGHTKVKSSCVSNCCNGKALSVKGLKFSYENIFSHTST